MQFLKPFVLFISINFLTASMVFAADFPTPEDAIKAYIDGVKKQDFDAIVEATAAKSMSKRFDFIEYVDRLQMLTLRTPVPSTSTLFVALNMADFTFQIANQVKFLTYGLFSKTEVNEGKQVKMERTGAAEFATVVNTQRLTDLKLLKIWVPEPEILNSERYNSNAVKRAKVYGAATLSERLAIIAFEDRKFVIGFTLLRYEEGWSILDQSSGITGLTPQPKQLTPEQFEAFIK